MSKAQAREGWNRLFGKLPELEELLPCKECGEHPDVCVTDNVFVCWQGDTGHPTFEASSVAEWNRRFGKQPQPDLLPCRKCGDLPELSIGGLLLRCSQCRDWYKGESVLWALQGWNRTYGLNHYDVCQCHPNPKAITVCDGFGGCVNAGDAIDNVEAQLNPHGLTPCECGEVPRAVAFQWMSKISAAYYHWFWGVECVCGNNNTPGHYQCDSAIGCWNAGDRSRYIHDNSTRRYDIPTDVVLGCRDLPEKYRQA